MAFLNRDQIFNTLDKNGDTPELILLSSRGRSIGKTYLFTDYLMDIFDTTKGKFVLLARTRAELGNIASGMMKEMLRNTRGNCFVTETKRLNGVYSDVYLHGTENGEDVKIHCGYVIPLNAADAIKKISSNFVDSVHGYFDEYQPEYGSTYLTDEVEKFKSIHTSLARGNGQSRRFYPIYMSSNAITVTNPYFVALGLTQKIQKDTKRFKGDGYVYIRVENKAISEEHDRSPMSRAFSGLKSSHFSDNSWVNDNGAGVCKPTAGWGKPMYMATLVNDDRRYGIVVFPESGVVYITHNVDNTFPAILRMKLDGEPNLPLLRSSGIGVIVKEAIERGNMRYHSQTCKAVAFEFFV